MLRAHWSTGENDQGIIDNEWNARKEVLLGRGGVYREGTGAPSSMDLGPVAELMESIRMSSHSLNVKKITPVFFDPEVQAYQESLGASIHKITATWWGWTPLDAAGEEVLVPGPDEVMEACARAFRYKRNVESLGECHAHDRKFWVAPHLSLSKLDGLVRKGWSARLAGAKTSDNGSLQLAPRRHHYELGMANPRQVVLVSLPEGVTNPAEESHLKIALPVENWTGGTQKALHVHALRAPWPKDDWCPTGALTYDEQPFFTIPADDMQEQLESRVLLLDVTAALGMEEVPTGFVVQWDVKDPKAVVRVSGRSFDDYLGFPFLVALDPMPED